MYVACCASSPTEARACSREATVEHVIDADEELADSTPPQVPVLGEVMIFRGSSSGTGCQSDDSCAQAASIGLPIAVAADDRTPTDKMGYVIELASGELPGNMTLPMVPVRTDSEGMLWLGWRDRQEDVNFTLAIRTMDLGGNLSEPAMVQVSDNVSGCSAGTRSGSTTLAMIVLALAWSLRKRRDALSA